MTTDHRPGPSHDRDSDCTLDADGQCEVCGVSHTETCDLCGGRGFHADEDCPELCDRSSVEYTEAMARKAVRDEEAMIRERAEADTIAAARK